MTEFLAAVYGFKRFLYTHAHNRRICSIHLGGDA